jgi:hypothetical protein
MEIARESRSLFVKPHTLLSQRVVFIGDFSRVLRSTIQSTVIDNHWEHLGPMGERRLPIRRIKLSLRRILSGQWRQEIDFKSWNE